MDSNKLYDSIFQIDYYNHRVPTSNWIIEDSTIDFLDLTYVVDGQAEYTINGKKYLVRKGDLICIPPESRRSAVTFPGKPIESHCLNGFLYNMKGDLETPPFPLITNTKINLELLDLFFRFKTIWSKRQPGYQLLARAFSLLILHKCIDMVIFNNEKEFFVKDTRIKNVISYTISNYHKPLSTKSMAKSNNLSPTYFGSLFKEETGISYNQFLNSTRLDKAYEMLARGECNVGEASGACGFSDTFYFSKQFKKYHGFSPSNIYRYGTLAKNNQSNFL